MKQKKNSKLQTLGLRETSAQHEEKKNMRRVNKLPIKTHNTEVQSFEASCGKRAVHRAKQLLNGSIHHCVCKYRPTNIRSRPLENEFI
jgi:hypothetical protein